MLATIEKSYVYEVYVSSKTAFNPENNETAIINYSLSATSLIIAKVYCNDSGELIETIVNENKNAGAYNAVWDGKDESQDAYEDGVYVISIKNGEQAVSREVTLRSY